MPAGRRSFRLGNPVVFSSAVCSRHSRGVSVGTFVRMAHQPCEPEECRALFHHGALFHFHHLLLGLFAERQWVSGGLYCRYGHRPQPPVQEEGNRNFS